MRKVLIVTRRWTIAAFVASLAAGILATWPLVLRLGEAIPANKPDCTQCEDAVLCTWIVGEAGRRLYADPKRVFEATIFHPLHDTLAFSESMLAAGLFVGPVNALTGNPVLGYGLYYLATAVFAAFGTFLLVRRITRDPWAALAAAWFVGLAIERFRMRQLLPAIAVHWVPFVLWSWLRMLDRPTVGRALVLGGTLVLHLHTTAYHGFMLPVLLVPWALGLMSGGWTVRSWISAIGAAGVALAAGLVPFLPYLRVQHVFAYAPPPFLSDLALWYVGAFAEPARYLADIVAGVREPWAASPIPWLVLGAAIIVARRPAAHHVPHQRVHLAAALLFTGAAIAVSFGPAIILGPTLPTIPGPFTWLGRLPGFSGMRAPSRFMMLAVLGAATILGLALAAVFRRLNPRLHPLATLGIALLVTVDSRVLAVSLPLMPLPPPYAVPPVYRWLAEQPANVAVLELPQNSVSHEVRYQFFSLYHGHRLMNGYSAIIPDWRDPLSKFPDATSIQTLIDAGVRHVILHTGRAETVRERRVLKMLRRRSAMTMERIGSAIVLRLPSFIPPTQPPSDPVLDLRDATVRGTTLNDQRDVHEVLDGDSATVWLGASTADAAASLEVHLAEPAMVTGVRISLGPYVNDYPRRWRVEGSTDGTTWTVIGQVDQSIPPLASYRRDPNNVIMHLPVQPTTLQWLRLTVPAGPRGKLRPAVDRWRVVELAIEGSQL